MTAEFQVTIQNRKLSTLWYTGDLKSDISEKFLQKIHCTDKVQLCTGIRLSSTGSSIISPIDILPLRKGLGAHTNLKQNFKVCRNLRRLLILGLDFHHKFCICTSWDSDGKLFLHKDGKAIIYTRTQKFLAKYTQ